MSETKDQVLNNFLDYLIDRIHELAEKGLLDEATSLYQEYSEWINVPYQVPAD
jgi:hypothetical protein